MRVLRRRIDTSNMEHGRIQARFDWIQSASKADILTHFSRLDFQLTIYQVTSIRHHMQLSLKLMMNDIPNERFN